MKIQRAVSGAITLLFCMVICLSVFTVNASAYEWVDVEKETSLTLECPCPNAQFHLYKVADMSAYGKFTLTKDFSGYQVSLEQENQSGWRETAAALSGYTARDQIKPFREGSTDEAGKLKFSELSVGLYLVVGDKCEYKEEYYFFTPTLIALPDLNNADQWVYDVSASPKFAHEPVIHPIDLNVMKVWKDNESDKRPESIQVQLLRNNEIWSTVELSVKNDWKYTWVDLDDRYTWQVVEKEVPEGYKVSVQNDGSTIVLTNSLNTPDKPTPPDLPQTGVLWWPVGALLVAGLALLVIGVVKRKKNDE